MKEDTLEKIKKTAIVIQKETKAVKIKTREDLENAVTLLSKIRTYTKLVEDRRMEIARPILDGLKKLKADYDTSKIPYIEADKKLSGMIKIYRDKEADIIRKKQEKELERQRIQFEKEQEEKRKELEDAKDELTKKEVKEIAQEIEDDEFEPTSPTITQEKTIHADTAKLTIKNKWSFEIEDAKKVPRKFLKVDEVAIGKAIRSEGVREIKGVKIFQEEII